LEKVQGDVTLKKYYYTFYFVKILHDSTLAGNRIEHTYVFYLSLIPDLPFSRINKKIITLNSNIRLFLYNPCKFEKTPFRRITQEDV